MNRLGAILIPMLAGFLVTIALVSWHSRWWQRDAVESAAAITPNIEVRRPNLRVVRVHVTASPAAAVAAAPVTAVAAARAAQPEPVATPPEPPPVPRESPARKFARGSTADVE